MILPGQDKIETSLTSPLRFGIIGVRHVTTQNADMKRKLHGEEDWRTVIISGKTYLMSSLGKCKNSNGLITGFSSNKCGPEILSYRLGGREKTAARWMCYAFYSTEVARLLHSNTDWCAIHMDGDVTNDTIQNIQVRSRGDCGRTSQRLGKKRKNNPDARLKPINRIHPIMRTIKNFKSASHAHEEMGYCASHISSAANGRTKDNMAYEYCWQWDLVTLKGELWTDCVLYRFRGAKYSNLGRIQTTTGIRTYGTPQCKGYMRIKCNKKLYLIHQLIALESMPNEYKECIARCRIQMSGPPQVEHCNGDREDNRKPNLMWVTPLENAWYKKLRTYCESPDDEMQK